jgi:hypothetical protein
MQKFLTLTNGEFSLDNGIQATTGISNAGQVIVSDASGHLDPSFISDTKLIVTTSSLAAGQYVNVWNNSGVANARLASAVSFSLQAHGFVLASYNVGDTATVYFSGANTAITGAVPGNVFLSKTPGGFSSTPPDSTDINNSGNIIQKIGIATSSTNINFTLSRPIGIA